MTAHAVGLEVATVRLVPYDRRWPDLAHRELARLRFALDRRAVGFEHVGSTSVPGLVAKPVLDLLVGVPRFADAPEALPLLEKLGYEQRQDDTVPERVLLVREADGMRTHNLHLCEFGGRFWREHLRFRDRLRTDREVARDYVALKRELAGRFPRDRLAYTSGKDGFVARVLGEAR